MNANVTKLSHEVTGIKVEVDKVNSPVDTMQNDMNNMKEELEAAQKMAREPCTSTGSRRSAASSTNPTRSAWTARVIHVRGWAPFASKDDRKLSRTMALALQKHIDTLVHADMVNKDLWLNPSMRNHSISMEAFHAQNNTSTLLAGALGEVLQRNKLQVNECGVKVEVETSPMRRGQLKIFYSAADEIKARNPQMRLT